MINSENQLLRITAITLGSILLFGVTAYATYSVMENDGFFVEDTSLNSGIFYNDSTDSNVPENRSVMRANQSTDELSTTTESVAEQGATDSSKFQIIAQQDRGNVREAEACRETSYPIDIYVQKPNGELELVYNDISSCRLSEESKYFEDGDLRTGNQSFFEFEPIIDDGEYVGGKISWGGPDGDPYWFWWHLHVYFHADKPSQTVLVRESSPGPDDHGVTSFSFTPDDDGDVERESKMISIAPSLNSCTKTSQRDTRGDNLPRYYGVELVDHLSIRTRGASGIYTTAWRADEPHAVQCVAEVWQPTRDVMVDRRYLYNESITNIRATAASEFKQLEFSFAGLTWRFNIENPERTMYLIADSESGDRSN